MLKANSTIDAQTSLSQLLGQEHSSYLAQCQTASPGDMHSEHPANPPTHHQDSSLQGDSSTSMSASTSPNPAQGDSSAQHHTAIEGTDLQGKPLKPYRQKGRGRGATGMPRGRPPGAKNKPKGPDHGLPKMPKKRGRPLGAKNKYPPGTPMAPPPWALDNRRPTESGSSQRATSTMAAGTTLVIPPSTRTDAQTPPDARANYTAPNGYAPVTAFSVTLDDEDRGYDHETGVWYSIRARAGEQGSNTEVDQTLEQAVLALASSSSSTQPEDFMTPMAVPYPAPAPLTFATQYPPLAQSSYAFNDGNFAAYNDNSDNFFPPPSYYPGAM